LKTLKVINQATIQAECKKLDAPQLSGGIFITKTGNEWLSGAKEKPKPNVLFFNVWHEGEVCILYAETNVGKSILAVQIGVEIARTQIVIYFDFELSDKQFEARYSNNFQNHYNFPDNFLITTSLIISYVLR
jgi:hypothetical protein